MLDFYEVWGKEILKKRIATFFAVLFGFLLLLDFVWSILTEVPSKTVEDFAYQYAVERFTYLPWNVEDAYFSRFQHTYPGYRVVAEQEIKEIKNLKLASFFLPRKVTRDKGNLVKVVGTRITGTVENNAIQNIKTRTVIILLRAYALNRFEVEKVTQSP